MNINNHKFLTKANGKHEESFAGSSTEEKEVEEVHMHGST